MGLLCLALLAAPVEDVADPFTTAAALAHTIEVPAGREAVILAFVAALATEGLYDEAAAL